MSALNILSGGAAHGLVERIRPSFESRTGCTIDGTFSAVGAYVLKQFTGSDTFGSSFTAAPGSSQIEPGITPSAAVTLSWPTYSAAAAQAGTSRQFGGIGSSGGSTTSAITASVTSVRSSSLVRT